MKGFVRTADIIITAAAVLLGAVLTAVLFCAPPSAKRADIMLDGKLYRTVSLSENAVYTLHEAGVTVTVENGAVAVTESGCPDKICVHTGFVSASGRSIVCLPAKLVIILHGEAEADAVA